MSFDQPVVMEPRAVVKGLRTVWGVMLVALFLYAFVLTRIPRSANVPLTPTGQFYISMVGIVTGAVVLFLRFVRIPRLASPDAPIDNKKLARQAWVTYILCYVFSESTGLFGFVLAFNRCEPKFYVPLYLGGVLLMVLCYPRLPFTSSHEPEGSAG